MFFSISVHHDDLYHLLPKIFLSYKLTVCSHHLQSRFFVVRLNSSKQQDRERAELSEAHGV
jgi:hypothetical protein